MDICSRCTSEHRRHDGAKLQEQQNPSWPIFLGHFSCSPSSPAHYPPRTIKSIYCALFWMTLLTHCCSVVTFHFPPLVRDEAMRLLELGARHGASFLHVGGSSAAPPGWWGGHSWFTGAVHIWQAALLRVLFYLQSCIFAQSRTAQPLPAASPQLCSPTVQINFPL